MENLLKRYPSLEVCKESIETAIKLIRDTYKNGGKVLVCGNGGSCCFFNQAALFCCLLSIPTGDGLFYLAAAIWMAGDCPVLSPAEQA